MNVQDAYVIAHMNPNEDMPDYLTDEDQIPMRFKTKEEAEGFIWSIAPVDFDLDRSSIKIHRIQ
jgi:hypothetical protein